MVSIPLQEVANSLTVLSWEILEMLSKTECLSYTDIKQKLNIRSHDKASKEIARLEGALLITLTRDEMDSRQIKIAASRYGFEILKLRKGN